MHSGARSNAIQEEKLISGPDGFWASGMILRVRRAALVLAAFAILSCVTVAQTPDENIALSHKRVAAASGSPASGAPTKTIGNKSAPIAMELFSDYQCPSCGGFFENTLRPMINTYIVEGKVFLVHHDFPLQKHAYSGEAARWANAGAKIGKFQEVDAALYDSQDKWSIDGDMGKFVAGAISPADYKRVQAIMKTCIASAPTSRAGNSVPTADSACSVDEYIVQDIVLGYQLPVIATLTFVIHYKGQSYPATPGGVSWPILKQFFDTLLSQ
jgi:thioredoxin family protein